MEPQTRKGNGRTATMDELRAEHGARRDPPAPHASPSTSPPPQPHPTPQVPLSARDHEIREPLAHDAPPKKGHPWVWLIVLAVLGVAGYFAYPHLRQLPAIGGAKPAAAPKARDIPVKVATAHKGNLNQYLNGLGTVTPFNTVMIRPRVDGQIVKVSFREGQLVRQGNPLVEIDPRPFEVQLAQAQGQWARDKAQLDNAISDLKRYQEAGPAVAQQQIENQQFTINQFEGVVKSDQSQIDNAKLNLIYCHVTAPISGRAGLRLVDEGNMVHPTDSSPLVIITQLQPISVAFTIAQDDVWRVMQKPNGGEGLPVEAYDRDFTRKIATGKLMALDNQVDVTTGTLRLKASFDNDNNELFPNQFVNARLLVDTVKDAIIIPAAAVQRGPDSTFCYVVAPGENTVDLRPIELGPQEGERAVVAKGLSDGDVVVTDGVDKLQKGTRVVPRQDEGKGPGSSGRGGRSSAATEPASQPGDAAEAPTSTRESR
jgi:multidrug efflux system membrane fusion protein